MRMMLPTSTPASLRLKNLTGIALMMAVVSTLIGLPAASAIAATPTPSPAVAGTATSAPSPKPAPSSASSHQKPPAAPPTATATPAQPSTKGWSSQAPSGKKAPSKPLSGSATVSPMTSSLTYTLEFQQGAWQQGYSTAHYWIDGTDLGSFDSGVVTSPTQYVWTDIAIDVTAEFNANPNPQQHVTWKWDHYGGWSAASVRNMRIVDSAGTTYWDQYYPGYVDGGPVGISGNPSQGGPPSQQINADNGQWFVTSSGYVDHYLDNRPTVSRVSPTCGSAAGGSSVVITGNNLTGATGVKFGSNPVPGFTVNSDTQISATTPAGQGVVPVTVTTPSGTTPTSGAAQYAYVSPNAGSPLCVFVGYADNLHGTSSNFPSPWQGSPNVAFAGSGPSFDGGAVRIDNASNQPVALTSVSVDLDAIHLSPWPQSSLVVPANGSLILTGANAMDFNTSDVTGQRCANTYLEPLITISTPGLVATWIDTAQVLNTGGIDPNYCSGANESIGWKPVAPGATSAGGPNPTVPGVTCSTGEPVDCATGEFYQQIHDLSVPGRGVPLDFSRTYSSLTASQDGPLGFGWTDGYNMSLSVEPARGVVTIRQENGSSVSAVACQPATGTCPSTGYQFPSFVEATLAHNADGTYTFSHVNQNAFVFSASGQLLREVDRNGYATTLTYANGALSAITDPAGRSLSLAYGANARVASVSDPAGRRVAFGYDASGNLTSATDPAGVTTTMTYDAAHRMLTATDPRGGVLTNVYDSSGRVITQTDAMGRTTTLAYSPGATTITDPAGHVSFQRYAGLKLASTTNGYATPQAVTSTYVFDPATWRVASVTEPNGHATVNTYDAMGNLLTSTDALGRTTSYTWDALNDETSVTDPTGVKTTMTYDAAGNLLSRSTPLTATGQQSTTTLAYDPAHPGDVIAVTDPLGNRTSVSYDANGDIVSATDPAGDRSTFGFNAIGWRISSVSPRGNVANSSPAAFTTTTSYNADGKPTAETDPLGHTVTATYDANQNRTSLTTAVGQTTSVAYDADNEPTVTTLPDHSTSSTSYDADGHVVAQTDGLNHPTTYAYDVLGHLVSTTDPLNRTTSFTYDPAGNRIRLTDPAGQVTSYTYDAANQLTAESFSDGHTPAETFTYDADGRQIDMTSHDGGTTGLNTETTSSYDSLGRLTANTETEGGLLAGTAPISYGYDLAGHLTSIANPTGLNVTTTVSGATIALGPGTLTRTYDAAGRMHSVTSWAGNTTTFGYDANSNLVSIAFPNATVAAYSYDAADHTTAIVDTAPTVGTFLNLPYTYDANGRMASDSATSTPVATTRSYGYDPAGHLASASLAPAPVPATKSWGYDAASRLVQMAHLGQTTTTLNYDAADELTSTTNAAGATTGIYSYDARGNRTQVVYPLGVTATYTYDQANRLTSYTGPLVGAVAQGTTTQASYTYQPDGLRADLAWNRAEGMPLILSSPIQVPGGVQEYVTGPGGRVVEIDLVPIASSAGTIQGTPFTTTQTVYVHADAMGSTRVLTDASGHPIFGYTYDPYGQASATTLSASTLSIVNPFLFQGQFVDPLSAFIYLRNRWYDPTTAQFLTKDPLDTLTRSAYRYANGDPVNGTDPSGLCPAAPSSPGACPQWVKDVVQFIGFGDFIRLGWDLVNGGPVASDAGGSGWTLGENAALEVLKRYAAANGLKDLAGLLATKWVLPVSLMATVIDGACTTIDRNNSLNKRP